MTEPVRVQRVGRVPHTLNYCALCGRVGRIGVDISVCRGVDFCVGRVCLEELGLGLGLGLVLVLVLGLRLSPLADLDVVKVRDERPGSFVANFTVVAGWWPWGSVGCFLLLLFVRGRRRHGPQFLFLVNNDLDRAGLGRNSSFRISVPIVLVAD